MSRAAPSLIFVYAESLGLASEFLHRDELTERHGADQPPLPAVFVLRDRRPELLIAKAEIEACGDLDALIALLRARPLVDKGGHFAAWE